MMLFEVATSLGLVVDIRPQLNYVAYDEVSTLVTTAHTGLAKV